jgi:hypothetical protein
MPGSKSVTIVSPGLLEGVTQNVPAVVPPAPSQSSKPSP